MVGAPPLQSSILGLSGFPERLTRKGTAQPPPAGVARLGFPNPGIGGYGLLGGDLFLQDVPMFHDKIALEPKNVGGNERLVAAQIAPMCHNKIAFYDDPPR